MKSLRCGQSCRPKQFFFFPTLVIDRNMAKETMQHTPFMLNKGTVKFCIRVVFLE